MGFLGSLLCFRIKNSQKFPFQTVKIFLFKLSKFLFSNCQNFSFQTVKISVYCVAPQKVWEPLIQEKTAILNKIPILESRSAPN